MGITMTQDVAKALKPLDNLDVLVLVDNVTDLLSSVPAGTTPELPNLLKANFEGPLSGECLCCAHWGLSLAITATVNGNNQVALFDSGPEAYGIDRNSNRLGLDFATIGAVVLSHGHWDHSGGMLSAVEKIYAANGGQPVPYHVNPQMFEHRGIQFPDGNVLDLKDIPSQAELESKGATLVNESNARLILDDRFFISGEIPRVTPYEKGLPGHVKQAENGEWSPDPWVIDERFMAVNVKDKGIVVFTACSHAGVINVLKHARELFDPIPLYGVMGGFHLSGAACEVIIPETIEDLKQFDLKSIVAGHCTGWRATHQLLNTFGEEIVIPSAVGRLHTISCQ
tara:strand:- start:6381 stop:7400 length:1020 start_codon:yes stop_codon:yes gene_type:complete